MAQSSFLDAFLEDNPDILFQGFLPQTGSANFQAFSRGRERRVRDDYLGAFGRQALGGTVPTQSYQSFLRDYPFLQDFQSQSPQQRGVRSAPRVQYNIGR